MLIMAEQFIMSVTTVQGLIRVIPLKYLNHFSVSTVTSNIRGQESVSALCSEFLNAMAGKYGLKQSRVKGLSFTSHSPIKEFGDLHVGKLC